MRNTIGKLNLFKLFQQITVVGVQHKVSGVALGRWATVSSEAQKMRRIDLANMDSCGDETCSNPSLLIQKYKDAYYLGGEVTKHKS